jgi:DNA mismatch repair ATPase MutS
MIKAAQKLQKTNTIIKEDSIREHLKMLRPFVKNYSLLNFGIPGDDLSKALFYILELLKACFLLELHLLNNSYSQIINQRESLKKLFEYIGEFDFAISMASLKSDTNFTTCIPDLVLENKVLKFTNAIHPMIEKCVPNSFSLEHQSAFITGSNMSGKSTFLRTILINSILAQTIYLCFAKSYSASFLKPFSSITIEDSLLEGSSYFFTEVEIVKEMTVQVPLSPNHLFVIDETFKGTNTLERISLAKAVLEFLNNNDNIVIASSHDLELIDLISKDFELYYFTETIKDNYLNFDHTIKPGFLKTTNAIKIIEIENYPQTIINDAYKMTKEYKAGNFVATNNEPDKSS